MNITDELREWMKGSTLSSWTAEHLLAIADRIDAEYQKAIRELNNLADASMPIPVDADGVPIRVGDVMDFTKNVRGLTVLGIGIVDANESSLGVFVREGNDYVWYNAEFLHHHAPTVEDVLREFAEKMNENMGMYTGEAIDADEWRDADAKTIAEYAKRLTLAGDA